jgi:mannosidase alpha-like ER degradation enhancer 2
MDHISKYDTMDSVSSAVYSDLEFILTVYYRLDRYIFSTEGHLLPITPEIALVDEHCSYFGAFCNGSADHGYGTSASSMKHKKANYTHLDDIETASSHYSASNMFATRGYIKVTLMCS